MPLPTNPNNARKLPNAESPSEASNNLDVTNESVEVNNIVQEAEEASHEGGYVSVGSLTADQLLQTPYSRFAHLEQRISEVVGWVQDVLTEKNKAEELVTARIERGKKYEEMVKFLDTLILRHISAEKIIRGDDRRILVASVINELLGLGPIEPLWSDPRITEIMVNGPYRVRAEIGGKLIDVPGARFRDADHLLTVCQQILGARGRRIDVANPMEDGRLADGSRINAVHPALAPKGPYLTIRRFPDTIFDVKTLVSFGSMTEKMAEEIGNLVYAGCSTVIVGGTGSGKTSFLNAMSGCIPPGERVITVEDNLELQLHPARDVVALEARPASAGGTGGVTIRHLMKNTLRMRPDRIVVGEVRDASAYDMLQAMNTGHDGSLTTVHANDAEGAVERLINLVTESGEMAPERAMSLIASGVDIFVVIDRFVEDGSRRVVGIYEVPSRVAVVEGIVRLDPVPLWEWETDGLDEDGKVYGHYERKNPPSEKLIHKKRLDRRRRLTIDDIYRFSSADSDLSSFEFEDDAEVEKSGVQRVDAHEDSEVEQTVVHEDVTDVLDDPFAESSEEVEDSDPVKDGTQEDIGNSSESDSNPEIDLDEKA